MRVAIGLVLGGGMLLLTGCAAEPAVDLDDAQAWLDSVVAEQSDGPGAAGTASMLVDTGTKDPDDGEHGIRIDFANPVVLKRADARCYGGGDVEADVTVEVRSADGSTMSLTETIPCDEEPHGIDLSTAPSPSASAVVDGSGTTATYLHVTLLQELTISR